MIERVFYSHAGETLLNLHRWTQQQAMLVKSESFPDLEPIGRVEEVPGTGMTVFVGERRPKAGQFGIVIGTYGRSHEDAFTLQREILRLVPDIGAYGRVPGGTLELSSYIGLNRSFAGSAQLGGTVEITFRCASPYFWVDQAPVDILPGVATPLIIGGSAPAPLRVEITAGEAGVTNPRILTDAGLLTWNSTLPAGKTLVVDNMRNWTVELDGVSADVFVTGAMPYLNPGAGSITVIAPGATVKGTWREGEL